LDEETHTLDEETHPLERVLMCSNTGCEASAWSFRSEALARGWQEENLDEIKGASKSAEATSSA